LADGFLAIDNYSSAILLDKGINPLRNHKQKLNLMLSQFRTLLQKAETTQDALERFYDYWQNVQYSSSIPSPIETLDFFRLSYRIISTIIKELANRNGKSYEELE